jgi:hypothetical protein
MSIVPVRAVFCQSPFRFETYIPLDGTEIEPPCDDGLLLSPGRMSGADRGFPFGISRNIALALRHVMAGAIHLVELVP